MVFSFNQNFDFNQSDFMLYHTYLKLISSDGSTKWYVNENYIFPFNYDYVISISNLIIRLAPAVSSLSDT